MKKIVLYTIVLILLIVQKQNLFARQEGSCGAIHRDFLVFIKNYNGEAADMITVGLFTGYVMASLDWYIYFAEKNTGEKPKISAMTSVGEIALVCAKYLENNPDQHKKKRDDMFYKSDAVSFSINDFGLYNVLYKHMETKINTS